MRLATDPPVSEAQRRAMGAAASGHSTLGIPQSVGREYLGKDMTQRDWRGLFGSLFKFFSEEAKEPEHAADGAMAAAGVMFFTPEGKVLFLKRAGDGDHKDEWCLPGGGVEEGETFEDAARREANEEVGRSPEDLRPIDRRVSDEDVDFATYAHPAAEEFKPKLNDEHSEYKWASPSDPPQPLHPGVAETLEALAEEEAEDDDDEAEDAIAHDPKNGQFTSGGGGSSGKKKNPAAKQPGDTPSTRIKRVLEHHGYYYQDTGHSNMMGRVHRHPETKHEVVHHPSGGQWTSYSKPYIEQGSGAGGLHRHLTARKKTGKDSTWQRFGHVDLSKGGLQPLTSKSGQLKHAPSSYGEDEALGVAFDKDSVRSFDKDGRLRVAKANISRATVNPYFGHEIPNYEELGLDPNKKYMLLRDPEELRKASASFNSLPILSEHVPLTAETHKPELVVGATGSDANFDGEYLTNSLVFWPQEAIDDIEDESKRELSCCYHYRCDLTPGTYKGQPFQGIMRDIVGNHVSLVSEGRAGPTVLVADAMPTDDASWQALIDAILRV